MGPAEESLLSHVSTDVKGTFGYLCPEYFQTRMLSFKSDVYAFGVVLLEVLTGRPAVDIRLSDDQHSLFTWVRDCIRNGNVDGIIDPTLLRQIAPACLTKYVGIAQSCLKTVPRDRPSTFDVVRHLNSALELQHIPDSEDVTEVGKIYNDGSSSFTAETIISLNEDDIKTSSMEKGSDSLRYGRPGLKEQLVFNNVPPKKWWNFFRYFQKSQKSQYRYGNFSINEILVATNNFSNSLGIDFGGSKAVCKGQTSDGKRVVVLWSQMEEQAPETIRHELQLILGMSPSGNHAPASSLIGYYVDKYNVVLLFDDIDVADSSLHSNLHNPIEDPLSWKQRLTVCIDAARVHRCLLAGAMQFLNITSKSILLDEGLITKIDLYSAASRITTNNHVHLDSDFIRDEKSREKSAVFSFGILLYEVLCAGEASKDWFEMNPATVAQWIKPHTEKNYTRHIDPYLIEKISPESSETYLEIASRCLHPLGRERPSMSEIVSMLEMALHLQEATENN